MYFNVRYKIINIDKSIVNAKRYNSIIVAKREF